MEYADFLINAIRPAGAKFERLEINIRKTLILFDLIILSFFINYCLNNNHHASRLLALKML